MAQRSFSSSLYLWTRQLHYYVGLFLCPFVVIFAVTTIALNHSWRPDRPEAGPKRTAQVSLPEGVTGMELARDLMAQLELSGEYGAGRNFGKGERIRLNLMKPGVRTQVIVDRATGTAEIEEFRSGFMDAMRYLHFTPGPHRGGQTNWIWAKAWAWLADSVIYLLLFISISGIYMWAVIKAERRIGLILLGAGVLSFLGLFGAIL